MCWQSALHESLYIFSVLGATARCGSSLQQSTYESIRDMDEIIRDHVYSGTPEQSTLFYILASVFLLLRLWWDIVLIFIAVYKCLNHKCMWNSADLIVCFLGTIYHCFNNHECDMQWCPYEYHDTLIMLQWCASYFCISYAFNMSFQLSIFVGKSNSNTIQLMSSNLQQVLREFHLQRSAPNHEVKIHLCCKLLLGLSLYCSLVSFFYRGPWISFCQFLCRLVSCLPFF